MLLQRGEIILDAVVDADVDHLETRALHHHAHQVFADVVNVALDGADDHLAYGFGPRLRQQGAQHLHPPLHGVGGQQHLRHEQDAVAKIDAHDLHASHQGLVQHLVRPPAPPQEKFGAFHDLVPQAVVEIVVHLLHQFGVVQLRQDHLVVLLGGLLCFQLCVTHVELSPVVSALPQVGADWLNSSGRRTRICAVR